MTLLLGLGLLASFVFLVYRYLKYLEVRTASPGHGARKAAGYLFLGLIAIVGITTVFAEALFEWLGLRKPGEFEWLALAAYAIMALALVLIFRPANNGGKMVKNDFGQGNVINYQSKIKKQVNFPRNSSDQE